MAFYGRRSFAPISITLQDEPYDPPYDVNSAAPPLRSAPAFQPATAPGDPSDSLLHPNRPFEGTRRRPSFTERGGRKSPSFPQPMFLGSPDAHSFQPSPTRGMEGDETRQRRPSLAERMSSRRSSFTKPVTPDATISTFNTSYPSYGTGTGEEPGRPSFAERMASRRSSINQPETGDENGRTSFSERMGTGSRRPSFAEPRTPGPETANSLHPDHAKSLGLGNGNVKGKGSGRNPSSRHSRVVASNEIAQTVNIMRENIQSLAERGERLENLESRTESLALAARGFRKSSNRVRKIIWWKEMKMRLIIALVILIVVGLTVLSIVQALRPRHQEDVQLHVQVQAVPPKVTAAPVASPSPSPTAISTASVTPSTTPTSS